MDITTRFAPSPTGFLHIGGARTALFNFLFAQRFGGKYLLRIEDTDRERSTKAATEAILNGLEWLGLSGQEETVFQHKNIKRHQDIAQILLDNGSAYHCYCTPEELQQMRYKALKEGRKNLYDGSWRDRSASDAPSDISPVVRLKTELTGKTSINDLVQGPVTVDNEIIDDFILLRADGSPTYMHSVVVDDHDMQVSHVIRGDDHLNNAFRQIQLYKAMGWEIPVFAHMPLIHGQDGTKLSKRHGAIGVESYRDLGYLPDALCNYLLRLGWSHGDDEIISREDALKWFDFDKVGQSASRFDITKLDNINSIYIKNLDDDYLIKLLMKELEKHPNLIINSTTIQRIKAGIKGLKTRVKTIKELAEISTFYMAKIPLQLDQKARDILNEDAIEIINGLRESLKGLENWSELAVEAAIKLYAEKYNLKLANVALPLRVALTGTTKSPSIFEVASVLGWDEVDLRIESVCRK